MAEQFNIALRPRPQPPGYGLRRGIFAIDAVNDPFDVEGCERPVDRSPRRLDRKTLAGNSFAIPQPTSKPASRGDHGRPSRRTFRKLFLDHEHAGAMQHPMPGMTRRAAIRHVIDNRLPVDGDEARGRWIRQHRSVRRHVACCHCRSRRRVVSMTGLLLA